VKRVFDLALAIPLAIVAVPIVLLMAVAIRIETSGAPIFLQPRVGRDGRIFRLVKLRTMHANTRHVASHEVSRAAITRLGAVIRKFKIDELPQLINVIAGQMSLVGPRPCLPVQNDLIAERQMRGVDRLSPGITGIGQISGLDMSDPVALAARDADYIRPWSAALDLAILWRTVSGRGFGDAATGGAPLRD
jgi:O-antigen biosynthesis protein WbqP